MSILVFGGTTEGRVLALRLAELGIPVTVSVASPLGAEELPEQHGLTVLVGRRTAAEMAAMLSGFSLCIDATHPYAAEATENIAAACRSAQVPLRRLLRGASETQGAVLVQNSKEAAAYLSRTQGNILLTTGAKTLPDFVALEKARLFVRVLPSHESISACEALGIPHQNILALQGPFSQKMNEAMLEQYHIRYLVTKDGERLGVPGKAGGSLGPGVELILISRGNEQGMDMEQIMEEVKEAWTCR